MKKRLLALPLLFASLAHGYEDVSLVATVSLKKKVPSPTGVLLAEDGRVFVGDASGKIAVFSANGNWLADWGPEKGADRLKEPRGLALGPNGDLYVSDGAGARIIVYSSDGKRLRMFGHKGAGSGELSKPAGLAVAADGSVTVADEGNKRVQVFSKDGVLLDLWNVPDAKAAAPAAVARLMSGTGALWGDKETRVRGWSGAAFEGEIPLPGSPAAVALKSDGGIFVGDASAGRVVEVDGAGNEINGFGSPGTGPGQFRSFAGLSAAPGLLAVLDDKTDRVQVFRVGNGRAAGFPPPGGRLNVGRVGGLALTADALAVQGESLWVLSGKKIQVQAQKGGAGREVKGDPLWAAPRSVAAHPEGVLVAEEGHGRVTLRDAAGKMVAAYGADAKGKGRIKDPMAVASDAQGRVYVLDAAVGRVLGYSRDGIPLFSVPVGKPLGLAGMAQGVAVVSGQKKNVVVLDERGKTLWETEPLEDPVAVAAETTAGRPVLYVLEAGAPRISVWVEKRRLGFFGGVADLADTRALTADAAGGVWVAGGKSVQHYRVSLRPAVPTNLVARGNDGAVELTWASDEEGRAAGYRMARSTSAVGGKEGSFFDVPAEGAAPTTWRDEEIIPGLTYYYTLRARAPGLDGEVLESPSARVSVWTVRPANLPPVAVSALKIDSVFSADYKRYADAPIGAVEIKNNTEETYRDVKIAFTVVDFMDFQSEQSVDRLLPGARQEFPLKAVFNNKILSVSEDTPVQAQVTVSYYRNGEAKIVTRTEPFRLYSRNAMDWTDPARLATFVTPKDTPVLEYGRALVGALKSELSEAPLPLGLSRAVAVHTVLGAQGLTYLKDPNNPFQKARQAKALDYVQFPRETLKRKTGDCDDLVVLYASLLESLGVPTRVADVPGHVLILFRLDDPRAEALTADRSLRLDDGVWIPIETTWVGKSFEDAWREGARALQKEEGTPRTVDVQEAWGDHPPATLSEELPPALPDEAGYRGPVKEALAQAARVFWDDAAAPLRSALAENPQDKEALLDLGLLYAEAERWSDSAEVFDRLLAVDPENPAAINNRANLYLLAGQAGEARTLYQKAARKDPSDAGIQLNLVRAAKRAGDKVAAQAAFRKALEIAPELKAIYAKWEEVGE